MRPTMQLIPVTACFLVATVFFGNVAFSQGNNGGNANPNNNASGNALKWETQGNNADTSHFIGTTNPTALKMRTNNVERLRITDDGKLGIGISNPLEKFQLEGNLKLSGDIIFSDYADVNDTTDKMIFVDEEGRTKTKGTDELKSLMYNSDCVALPDASEPGDIGTLNTTDTLGVSLPTWANTTNGTKNILYTGTGCSSWVGIGTDNPKTILDVRGNARFTDGVGIGGVDIPSAGLHLQNHAKGAQESFQKLIIVQNSEGRKMLQLENDGLLRAREIKVDEETWADYVFEEDYALMSLSKVKAFINEKGHLPNVPSAEEIENDGVNLGKTARITMEKVEELTLYTIQLKEALENQQELIEKQQEVLEQQQKELDALKKQ